MKFTLDQVKNSAAGKRNEHLFKNVVKKAKYGNSKTEYAGKRFDSKKEMNRYKELLLLQKIGEIGLIELQKEFLLIPKNETERAVKYRCDFSYIIQATGEMVVEDVKSKITRRIPSYIIKRKLMKEKFNIKIKEI